MTASRPSRPRSGRRSGADRPRPGQRRAETPATAPIAAPAEARQGFSSGILAGGGACPVPANRLASPTMNVTTFDKLAYIDALKANGVAEDQARAHAVALDTALHEVVATKADMAAVRADMATEFAAVRADMATEFAAVRADMATGFAEVRGEIATSKSEILRWVFGMVLGLAGLMVALNKLG